MRPPETFDLDAIKDRAAAHKGRSSCYTAEQSAADVPVLLAELERRDLAVKALQTLIRLEAGRIKRLTRSDIDLLSKAEAELARAWADAVEAVHS